MTTKSPWDIVSQLVYSHSTDHALLYHHCPYHHHHSLQTTPRRPVAPVFHVISSRDVVPSKKSLLTKTLVATSVLFIVCLAPTIMVQIASFVEPEFYFTGHYYNLAYTLRNVMVFFKASNSSIQLLHLLQHEHPGTARRYATFSETVCPEEEGECIEGRSPKRHNKQIDVLRSQS